MGPTAHGVGNNDAGAVVKQVVEISNIFARGRHGVCILLYIQWQQMAHRGQRSVMPTIALF